MESLEQRKDMIWPFIKGSVWLLYWDEIAETHMWNQEDQSGGCPLTNSGRDDGGLAQSGIWI